ncbi:LysR family transcriptional regulator [Yoonia sp. R2-816]|uniref:LysR family transcriptional regulator n=1 Tax=Yoonia sp. R2-816 TaxID=3342638 RepID=UPI003728F84E
MGIHRKLKEATLTSNTYDRQMRALSSTRGAIRADCCNGAYGWLPRQRQRSTFIEQIVFAIRRWFALNGEMVPKALHAFCLIMRRGSLVGAATDMNLSQPAVSRMITNLEHELGFTLFHRDRRALRPTDEARRFFQEAERILAGIEQLSDIASDIRKGTGQQVRVVAMSRLANSVLPRAAIRFREANPDIALTLETHHRREMERWLTGRQFDVGFGPLPIENVKLDIRPLGSTQAVVVLPKDHFLGARKKVLISDLIDENLLALTPDTLLQQQIAAAFMVANVKPRIGMHTSSSLIAVNLVAQGFGYTITDEFTAMCANGPVVVRPLVDRLTLDYGILTPLGAAISPATEAFIDCMKDAFSALKIVDADTT